MHGEDLVFIADGDIIFYEANGKKFNTQNIIDGYEIIKLLGKGGFGSVYQVKHKKTNKIYALKYIDFTDNCKYEIFI